MKIKANGQIDIIIPVYNALEDLKQCIASIIKYTDLEKNRVIIVNDKSPDENIKPYLDGINHKGFIIIHNETNLGFSANVNKGMCYDNSNDVILLNSDTIVTKNWVEKIVACAYSNKSIATVTPLSNNAALANVPNFCQENTTPDGYTIDEYADLIEKCSMKNYPVVPVAVGFCMFIKRQAIIEVGLFDAETFEKGYGEENDFCYRAIQLGYTNVLCDDTYIYHTGTVSFQSTEKALLCSEHAKILVDRYPQQNRDVDVFCHYNPIKIIQENVKVATELNNGKKTVLYVSHRGFQKETIDNIGGTQFHVRDLTYANLDTYNVVVLSADIDSLFVTLFTDKETFNFRYDVKIDIKYPKYFDKDLEQVFKTVLKDFSIDIVHIHHLKFLSMDIAYVADELNIPVVMSIHDHFAICPYCENRIRKDFICIAEEYNVENCYKCFREEKFNFKADEYLAKWQKEYANLFSICKELYFPSASARDILLNIFPDVKGKCMVIPHGVDFNKEPLNIKDIKDNKLNVAFVGGLSPKKGSVNAYNLMISDAKNITWHTFGMIGDGKLLSLNSENIIHHGEYKKENLGKLLKENNIDVVCLLSMFAETYSYVLTEVLMCNVPVIVTNQGALPERVREGGYGWVVSNMPTANEVLDILNSILENQDEYNSVLKNVNTFMADTTKKMAVTYQNEYNKFILNKDKNNFDKDNVKFATALMNADNNMATLSSIKLVNKKVLSTENEQAKAELEMLKSSLTFRILGIIVKIDSKIRNTVNKIKFKVKK